MGAVKDDAMRASGDDTPRETPAAKGSDSRISVAPPAWESADPPPPSANPVWMDETTRREPRASETGITRAEGRPKVVMVKVHSGVALVFVLALATLVLGTMAMVFVFAVGVGAAFALGTILAVAVLVCGRMVVRRFRARP